MIKAEEPNAGHRVAEDQDASCRFNLSVSPGFKDMKSPQESHVIILGAARNVAKTLERQVRIFDRAFAPFKMVSYVIVESDSTDETIAILSRLKHRKQNFHFISLGCIASELPLRTQRIAHARNAALDFCQATPVLAAADYGAVADWDGVNFRLTTKAVLSCWNHDWEVVTANQPDGYYDVWALRHPAWCPGDCWEECRRLEKELGRKVARQIAVTSRRIEIPENQGVISVDSAFGGLAIYKSSVLFPSRYPVSNDNEHEMCEHVAFHGQLRERGARIIINPAFVNTYSRQDGLPFFSIERFAHTIRRMIKRGSFRMKR